MADTRLYARFLQRHKNATGSSYGGDCWAGTEILKEGELGFEDDTGRFKIGDGEKTWDVLPYFSVNRRGQVENATTEDDVTTYTYTPVVSSLILNSDKDVVNYIDNVKAKYATVGGKGNTVYNEAEFVIGKYSVNADKSLNDSSYMFVLGGGTDGSTRKNLFSVDAAGNGYLAADLYTYDNQSLSGQLTDLRNDLNRALKSGGKKFIAATGSDLQTEKIYTSGTTYNAGSYVFIDTVNSTTSGGEKDALFYVKTKFTASSTNINPLSNSNIKVTTVSNRLIDITDVMKNQNKQIKNVLGGLTFTLSGTTLYITNTGVSNGSSLGSAISDLSNQNDTTNYLLNPQ